MNVFDVPDNVEATIWSVLLCSCGETCMGSTYQAIARAEYAFIGGILRRRFDFIDNPLPCGCVDHAWLSSDDGGIAVEFAREQVPVEREKTNE